MLTLEQIRKRLEPMNLALVAKACGIHYNTLYRLAKTDANVSYETVKKLSDYLTELND